jgi:hypothetical protein
MVIKPNIQMVVLAVLIFFLIVANPFRFYFLNDDFIHIPSAASGNFLQTNLLRPVADFTLWLDSFIWSKTAAGFHLTNILVHLLNSFLLYSFVKQWNYREEKTTGYKPVLIALLFLVYAFHSESVFWIIGRGGSLSTLLALLALNCYAYSKSYFSLVAALLFFIVGLFTYESIWILPAIFVVIQSFEYIRQRKPSWWWTFSFIVVFILYLIFRTSIDNVHFGDYESGLIHSFNAKKLAYNYFATVMRCFLPPLKSTSLFIAIASVFVLTGLAVVVFSWKRNILSYFSVPLACVALACLPTISLGIDIHDTEGERFLYLPSAFCCWLIVEVVWRQFSLSKRSFAIIGCLIIFHGYFFYRAADSYRYAGYVTKTFIHCLNMVPVGQQLTVVKLPAQYKGALIFRKGFPQAVNWLVPGKFNNVNVVTTSEIFVPRSIRCDFLTKNDIKADIYIEWKDSGLISFY